MSATATSDRPPPRFQFRLGTLLLITAGSAVVCAGIAMPMQFWAGALLLSAILSLLTSVVFAIYRRGASRAGAIGFMVFGGGYLTCVLVLDRSLERIDGREGMPTSQAAFWVFHYTHGQNRRAVTVTPGNFGAGVSSPPATPAVMQVPIYSMQYFIEIIHSVLILLFGVLGSIISRVLYITRMDSDERHHQH